MAYIFRLIRANDVDKREDTGVYIGIDVRLADQQITCPISGLCRTEAELETARKRLHKDLEHTILSARDLLKAPENSESDGMAVSPDMPPQEIWEVLSRIEDEEAFIDQFNRLPADGRMQVAEHVLTQCNVFQGRASFFAQRYDNVSCRMA